MARLVLGESALPKERQVTLQAYAPTWLDHIKEVCEPTTFDDYKKRLDQWILPDDVT